MPFLGLSGASDHVLAQLCIERDFTFVTRNERDFVKLFAAYPLHAGLVVIRSNLTRHEQSMRFGEAMLALAAAPDLVNRLLVIDADGSITVALLHAAST